ncbi:MAG: MarR family EPS-associated transcriptional regulator [Xanthomonadales bacterium]|nr:MarR family EPS-associated transcriptional regulator [Xanthomonadales bacterium]
MDDGTRYQLLRLLERNPALTQRELARELDFSLGKTNYCVRILVEKGWVKLGNFRRSRNKAAYLYQLTPSGLAAKARTTRRFLDRKLLEHEQLTREIEQLRQEVAARPDAGGHESTGDDGQAGPGAGDESTHLSRPRTANAATGRAQGADATVSVRPQRP